MGKLSSIVVGSTVGIERRQFGAAQIMRSEKGVKRRFRRQSVLFDRRQNLFHLGPVEGTHGMALDVAE
jgi:hypothetical protein